MSDEQPVVHEIGNRTYIVAPVEPLDVDAMVHTIFQALVSVAGYHLGDTLPNGDRLYDRDLDEAWLCLHLAGALYTQLFSHLSDEAGEFWRSELDNTLERFDAAAPKGSTGAAGASLVRGTNELPAPVCCWSRVTSSASSGLDRAVSGSRVCAEYVPSGADRRGQRRNLHRHRRHRWTGTEDPIHL